MSGNMFQGTSQICDDNTLYEVKSFINDEFYFRLSSLISEYKFVGSSAHEIIRPINDIDIVYKASENTKLDLYFKHNKIKTFKDFILFQFSKYETRVVGDLISICLKLDNGKKYQVDINLVDDLKYAQFSYYSDPTSKYKSLYRNELLFHLAHIISLKKLNLYEYSRYWYDLNKGLLFGKISYKGKNGVLKNPRKIWQIPITKDPLTIVKILLSNEAKLTDANSFESILDIILSPKFNFDSIILKEVLELTIKGLKKKKVNIPDELLNIGGKIGIF